MPEYRAQLSLYKTDKKTLEVINLTPQLADEERQKIRIKTERQLYEMFSPYVRRS